MWRHWCCLHPRLDTPYKKVLSTVSGKREYSMWRGWSIVAGPSPEERWSLDTPNHLHMQAHTLCLVLHYMLQHYIFLMCFFFSFQTVYTNTTFTTTKSKKNKNINKKFGFNFAFVFTLYIQQLSPNYIHSCTCELLKEEL